MTHTDLDCAKNHFLHLSLLVFISLRIPWELGLQARRTSKRKVVTTNSAHTFPRYPNLVEHLEIVRPDQV